MMQNENLLKWIEKVVKYLEMEACTTKYPLIIHLLDEYKKIKDEGSNHDQQQEV